MLPATRVLLAVFVLVAAAWDLRTGRIPNWLTAGGLICGLAVQTALGGAGGLRAAALGTAAALALALPLFALRGLGGGDVKMMAAAGAMSGWWSFLLVFVLNAVLGGVVAVAVLLWKRRLGSALANIGVIVRELLRFRAPQRRAGRLEIGGAGAVTVRRGPIFAAAALVVALFG